MAENESQHYQNLADGIAQMAVSMFQADNNRAKAVWNGQMSSVGLRKVLEGNTENLTSEEVTKYRNAAKEVYIWAGEQIGLTVVMQPECVVILDNSPQTGLQYQ